MKNLRLQLPENNYGTGNTDVLTHIRVTSYILSCTFAQISESVHVNGTAVCKNAHITLKYESLDSLTATASGQNYFISFSRYSVTKNSLGNFISSIISYTWDDSRGALGRLAAWHVPGGPVGLPIGWVAASNVEVGQMTYSVYRVRV